MIITRAPLRITFGGGATDLPSFSNKYEGFCISATINKYCYVTVNRTFTQQIFLKYSGMEKVKSVDEIEHPIFREAIRMLDFKTPQIEVSSIADVPSTGAGLGNSGAFTVALLKALYYYRHISVSQEEIARLACKLNMETLGKVQGKQDEYACSIGGINCFTFKKDGTVEYSPLDISYENLTLLRDNLMLFYTGISHNTNDILVDQEKKTIANDEDIIKNLILTKDYGYQAKNALSKGDLIYFGYTLNDQYEIKKARNRDKVDYFLDEIHYTLLEKGAIGNKIIGSGSGGFFMVYAEDKFEVVKYMKSIGMEEMRFDFDFEGCKTMV
jgi:D-glycero-alpha-D-manno-heptose-7-phosphate kinase